MNGIEQAAEKAGGQAALGRVLGVTPQAIAKFRKQGWVTIDRAKQINAQFGIPMRELVRPEVRDVMDAQL